MPKLPTAAGVSLETFGRLKAAAAQERADAAAALVAALAKDASNLDYTVQRLVTGLPSSSGCAREGFAAALASLLQAQGSEAVPSATVLKLVRAKITLPSTSSRQEKREYMMGRTFATLALARAGRLGAEGDVPASEAAKLFGELLEFAAAKKPLRELCYEAAALLIDTVKPSTVRKHFVPQLSSLFGGAPADYSPEVLGLALAVLETFTSAKGEGEVPFKRVRGLAEPKALAGLTEPLGEAAAASHPRLHTAWERAVRVAVAAGAASWRALWSGVAEDGLLQFDSSVKRKAAALMAFARLSAAVPAEDVAEHLLTPNLVRSLVYALQRGPSCDAHAAAREAAAAIGAAGARSSAAALTCVRRLLAVERNFDQRTKSRVVQGLVRQLGPEEAGEYLQTAAEAFAEAGVAAAEEAAEAKQAGGKAARSPLKEAVKAQKWAADQVYALGRAEQATEEVRRTALRFLMYHAFFAKAGEPVPAKKATKKKGKKAAAGVYVPPATARRLTAEARQACAARLFTLLSDLLPAHGEWGALEAHEYWNELRAAGHRTLTERSDEAEQAREAATEALRKARKAEDADERHESMRVLLLHSSLMMLGAGELREDEEEEEDDDEEVSEEDAIRRALNEDAEPENEDELAGILTDLRKCYEEWRGGKDDERLYMDVFVDALLALLSRPSTMLRDVAARAFATWCADMTESSVHTLLQVVGETASVGKDGDEDAEMEGADGAEEEEDDEDEDEEDESEEEEEDDDDEEEEDDDDDDDDDEEEEEDPEAADKEKKMMDEINTYNEHIVRILKLRKQRRSQQRALAQQAIHFRLRVMDLVEAFVRKHPENPLVYALYVPLLNIVRRARESGDKTAKGDKQKKPLMERALGLYKNRLCKTKEFPEEPEAAAPPARKTRKGKRGKKADEPEMSPQERAAAFEDSPSLPVLLELLDAAAKARDTSVVQLANLGALHVARGFAGPPVTGEAELSDRQRVVGSLYEAHLATFATKRQSRLNHRFFADVVAQQPALAWHLAAAAARLAAAPAAEGGAANSHLRADLLALLGDVSRQRADATNMAAHTARVVPLAMEAAAAAVAADPEPKHVRAALRAATAMAVAGSRADSEAECPSEGVFAALAKHLSTEALLRLRGPIKNFATAAGAGLAEALPAFQQAAEAADAKKKKRKTAAAAAAEGEGKQAGSDGEEEEEEEQEQAQPPKKKAKKADRSVGDKKKNQIKSKKRKVAAAGDEGEKKGKKARK